ncbi:MAG: ATP-binding cassette domain-containing protein [Novosphingobium sp.]
MSAPLLSIEGLDVRFQIGRSLFGKGESLQAVRDVSLTVEAGECVGIVGESGCGKSTLARAALDFVAPAAGRILWRGRDLATLDAAGRHAFRRAVQPVFQNPLGSLNPRMTVGDIIAEPLETLRPDIPAAERRPRAIAWLEKMGLTADMADRYPAEFSGGQAQRIAIARAMISEPEMLICDEAVSALDVSVKAQIVNLLQALQRETGIAIIFISHDLAIVRQIATRVMVMYLGRMMEDSATAPLFARQYHPYTQALLSAVPIPDPAAERARVPTLLRAEVPSPLRPPSGCVFHTRCPAAKPNCILAVPAPTHPADGRTVACHYAGVQIRGMQAAG